MITTTSAAPGGAINWIEPPTADIGAATAFYERALETVLAGDAGPPLGGSGVADDRYQAVPDIAAAIASCAAAGWRPLSEIIDLPAGIGRIVHMMDATGVRVGLHEPGSLV